MIKFRLFWLASLLCPLVPRRLGCKGAGLLGRLAYYLVPGARGVVRANLRVVLGGSASTASVAKLSRLVFCNAAKNYFDLFWLRKLDLDGFGKLVRVEGWDNLESAIAFGKGVVVITAHLGNFDICGQEIAARALDMTILLETIEPPQLLDLVLRLRASKGVKFVPLGPSALKEAFRALKRGGAVGVACDRDIQRAGLRTEFFGRVSSLPQGAAHMAVRMGAGIVPAFSERLPDDSFVIYIDPVMKVERTDNVAADTEVAMAMIVGAMEKRIGANPGQWVVFERIWPDTCPGVTSRVGEIS